MTNKITPFLWFDNQAEDAAKFYPSIFKNSKLGRVARYGEDAAKARRVMQAMMKMIKSDTKTLEQAAGQSGI